MEVTISFRSLSPYCVLSPENFFEYLFGISQWENRQGYPPQGFWIVCPKSNKIVYCRLLI